MRCTHTYVELELSHFSYREISKRLIEAGYDHVFDSETGAVDMNGLAVTPIKYELICGLDFGKALEALRSGMTVTRAGWNGKGMFLYLVPENRYPAQTDAAKAYFGDVVPYGAYIAMKTSQGNVVPWLASQTDVLAEDWGVVVPQRLEAA